MPHRDDREALTAKLEAQARELAEAKEENERLRASNARKATELERLRTLGEPYAAPVDSSDTTETVGSETIGFETAGTETASASHAPPRQPLASAQLAPHVRRQLGGLMIMSSLLVGGLSISAVRLAAAGPHSHGVSMGGVAALTSVHATYAATLTEASGYTEHQNGEACTVDATFDADARTQLHELTSLTIACNGETVYAPVARALEGAGVVWASETPGSARYELVARDLSSRNRLELDSWDGRLVITGAGYALELDVAPLSDEVAMPFAITAPAEAAFVRTGHVTDASGLEVGTACTVARRPTGDEAYAYRVVVRCDGRSLYGAAQTGYTYASSDERLSRDGDVSADDGDARMTLDLVQNEVHLEDGLGLLAQHVDIALD